MRRGGVSSRSVGTTITTSSSRGESPMRLDDVLQIKYIQSMDSIASWLEHVMSLVNYAKRNYERCERCAWNMIKFHTKYSFMTMCH